MIQDNEVKQFLMGPSLWALIEPLPWAHNGPPLGRSVGLPLGLQWGSLGPQWLSPWALNGRPFELSMGVPLSSQWACL